MTNIATRSNFWTETLKDKGDKTMGMNQEEALSILKGVGAIITNSHIVYTSGLHGTAYINKDAVYPYTKETSRLCRALAEQFSTVEHTVEAVIGPAIGGVILSQRVAEHLSHLQGNQVLSVYAEKDGDSFVIKRGYDKLITGKNILVVEDVLTTGASARKVVEVTRTVGGNVVGVGALCNRGWATREDIGNVPKFYALVYMKLEAVEESKCYFCKVGIPVNTDVGKGREFLARKADKERS